MSIPPGPSKAAIAMFLATATIAPASPLDTSQPFTLEQRPNAAGVAFTLFKINHLGTMSAAATMLMRLQENSVDKVTVQKDGTLSLYGASANDYFRAAPLGVTGNTNAEGGRWSLSMGSDASFGAALKFASDVAIGFNSASNLGSVGTIDTKIWRDVVGIVAFRDGETSHGLAFYDRWASATDYHRLKGGTARATLSGVTGASVTAIGLIPDGAVPVGITTKVTTGLGVSNGTTGYTVGTVADPDRWGDRTGTASGTSTDNTDWTAGTIEASIGASDVVITPKTGNFDGTGVIYVSVQYLIGQCD